MNLRAGVAGRDAQDAGDERAAYLMLTGMAICFGGTWVAGAWAVAELPPFAVAALRFGIAAVALYAWGRLARRRFAGVAVRDLPLVIGLGLTGIAGYNWFFLTGLTLAPASDGAIIIPGLAPVFTAGLAALLLGERFGWRGALGFLVAIAGLLLVVGPQGATSDERLAGDVMFLGGAAFWAAYSLLARVASRRFDAASATLSGMVSGTLVLIPLAIVEGGGAELAAATPRAWASIGYLAILGSVAAFVWFNSGVARIGAGRATAFTYLVPVVGVLGSAWLLGERVAATTLLGGVIVVGGMWLIQTRSRR